MRSFLDPARSQAERIKRLHDQMHAMNLPLSLTAERLKTATKELKVAESFVSDLEARRADPKAFFEYLKKNTKPLLPGSERQKIVEAAVGIVGSGNPKSSKRDEMKQRYFFTPFGSPLARLVDIQRNVAEARTVVCHDAASGELSCGFVVMASSLRGIAQTLPIAVHEGFHYQNQTREPGDEKATEISTTRSTKR